MLPKFKRRQKVVSTKADDTSRSYLLRDTYADTYVSPAPATRTSFPGPGAFSITHPTAAKFSSGGGVLTLPGGGGLADNYARSVGSINRKIGRALVVKAQYNNAVTSLLTVLADSNTAALDMDALYNYLGCVHGVICAAEIDIIAGQKHINSRFRPVTVATQYATAIVLQSTGAVYLYRKLSAPADSTWTILNVARTPSTSTLYPVIAPGALSGTVDSIEIYDLKGAWEVDHGTARSYTTPGVTLSAGYTQTHAANCLLQWSFRQPTTPTADTIIRVRKVDANNYWRVVHTVTGDLNLDKVVAGVPVNVINAPLVLAATTRNIVTLRMEGNNYALHIDYIAPDGYMFTTANATDSHAATGTTLEVAAAQGTALRDLVEWPIQFDLWAD